MPSSAQRGKFRVKGRECVFEKRSIGWLMFWNLRMRVERLTGWKREWLLCFNSYRLDILQKKTLSILIQPCETCGDGFGKWAVTPDKRFSRQKSRIPQNSTCTQLLPTCQHSSSRASVLTLGNLVLTFEVPVRYSYLAYSTYYYSDVCGWK